MNAIPNRTAFEHVQLADDVATARTALEQARVTLHAARGSARAAARTAFKRSQAALRAAEMAVENELHGERLAPAVQRRTIAHEGVVLREPRVVTHGKSATLVTALDRLRNLSSITDEQHAAGKRYRDAWEMAGMDAYPVGLGEGIGGTPSSGNRRIEEAVGCARELSRLRAVLGTYGTALVEHVVVHDLDVSAWAEKQKMDRKGAMGQLQLLLGMMVGLRP